MLPGAGTTTCHGMGTHKPAQATGTAVHAIDVEMQISAFKIPLQMLFITFPMEKKKKLHADICNDT